MFTDQNLDVELKSQNDILMKCDMSNSKRLGLIINKPKRHVNPLVPDVQ